MRVLVTGGSGFIGAAWVRAAQARGDEVHVLTRAPLRAAQVLGGGINLVTELDNLPRDGRWDLVLNLAGENLAAKRWTRCRKEAFIDSRVGLTRRLVEWMGRCETPPTTLISGSAVGYYGARDAEPVDEETPAGDEFQSELCARWEAAAHAAEAIGTRVCCLRLGVVLDRDGGALEKMRPAFRLGLGAVLGDGTQGFAWIHRRDVLRAIDFLGADDTQSGPFNLTAPQLVPQSEFARALGRAVGRPVLLRVPGRILQLLLGDMSRLLLTGQFVRPRRLLAAGFEFEFPELASALDAAAG